MSIVGNPYTPYAILSDFTTRYPNITLPANAGDVLRSANLLVARCLAEDLYNASTTRDQYRMDATNAQAAAWFNAGIDPTAGPAGIKGIVKSKALASGSITYDTPTAQEREAAITALAPDAYNILWSAGLLYAPLPVWSAIPDPGVYVDELGRVGGQYGYGYGTRPY